MTVVVAIVILDIIDINTILFETVLKVMRVWDAMIMVFSGAGSGSGSKKRCKSELHLVFKFVFVFGLMRLNFRLLINGWVSVNRLDRIQSSEKFKAS